MKNQMPTETIGEMSKRMKLSSKQGGKLVMMLSKMTLMMMLDIKRRWSVTVLTVMILMVGMLGIKKKKKIKRSNDRNQTTNKNAHTQPIKQPISTSH